MRSYKPEELFDANGCLVSELRELTPAGEPAHGLKSAREWRAVEEEPSFA
jgi:phosphoketolase